MTHPRLIINFEWYEVCLRNLQQTGRQIWNPMYPINAIDVAIEFPNVRQKIENRINGLAERIIQKITARI